MILFILRLRNIVRDHQGAFCQTLTGINFITPTFSACGISVFQYHWNTVYLLQITLTFRRCHYSLPTVTSVCELHRFIWHLCKSTADPNDETNERSFSDPIQGHILDKSDKYIPSRWKVDHKWKYDYLGAVSIRKTVLPGMAIPMLKIRRPNGRLIFNMEITIRR